VLMICCKKKLKGLSSVAAIKWGGGVLVMDGVEDFEYLTGLADGWRHKQLASRLASGKE
jgi:hypothetical protein